MRLSHGAVSGRRGKAVSPQNLNAVQYCRILPLLLVYLPLPSVGTLPSANMSDLSELATELQQQLDILNTYLKDKKLPQPSFLPPEGDVLKSPLDGLPPQVEEARKKAQGLSWSLSTLLQPPQVYLSWSALQVSSPLIKLT